MKRALVQVGWIAFQLAIIGFFAWVPYQEAVARGESVPVGYNIFIGICVAAFLTGCFSALGRLFRRLFARLTGRAVSEQSYPSGNSLSRPDAFRNLRKLPEEVSRSRIGQDTR